MAYEANESQHAKKSPAAQHPNDAVVQERVQELTWSMLDEQLADDEFQLLDNLLLSDDEARRTYLGCVQLHASLSNHFRKPAPAAGTVALPPVLGLHNVGVPLAFPSTAAEEVES